MFLSCDTRWMGDEGDCNPNKALTYCPPAHHQSKNALFAELGVADDGSRIRTIQEMCPIVEWRYRRDHRVFVSLDLMTSSTYQRV
jgi:hypothetical protein